MACTKLAVVLIALSGSLFAQCTSICSNGTLDGSFGAISCLCGTVWGTIGYRLPNYLNIPSGNEASLNYDAYWKSSNAIGSLQRILIDLHPGAWSGTRDSGYPSAASIQSIVNQGFVDYEITFMLDGAMLNSAQVDIGNTTGNFTATTSGFGTGMNLGGGGWTIVNGGETLTVTNMSGPLGSSPATVTFQSAAKKTHAANSTWAIPNINWPVQGNNISGFFSFLGQCAAGGSSPGSGACSPFKNKVPGDPNKIVISGESSGGGMALWLAANGCYQGSTCRFLNNTPGTPGYSSWTSRNWTWRNPWGVEMALLCPEADVASNFGLEERLYKAGSLVQDIGRMVCGSQPSCEGANPSCDNGANGSFHMGPWILNTYNDAGYSTDDIVSYHNSWGTPGGTNYTSRVNNNQGNNPLISPAMWSAEGPENGNGYKCLMHPTACYTACDNSVASGGAGLGALTVFRQSKSLPVKTWEFIAGGDYNFFAFDTDLAGLANVSSCFDGTVGHCGYGSSVVCAGKYFQALGSSMTP
jgi:hypothetical protein